MIQANELRINNWISHNNNYVQVFELPYLIDLDENKEAYLVNSIWIDEYRPIPITPEILEKCGFEIICHFGEPQDNNPNMDAINGTLCISKSVNKGEWVFGFDSIFATKRNNFVWGPIDYLHQLQNLYFALTGEELNYQP